MVYVPERKINLSQFRAISHAISTYEDVILLGRHIVESICRTFDIKAATVLVFDDREKQLYYVCSHGLSDEYLKKQPEYEDGLLQEFVTGQPVFFSDFGNDTRVQHREAIQKEGIVSMLSFPIKCRKAVVGLLKLYNNETWMIHDDDKDSINILSEQFGLVIENNGLQNFLDEVRSVMGNLPLRMLKGI
ncbi:MAG: GAF domain-containing protein [Proteobacteria bacterium]|nr:GAF domain-containing protein [Pseudomonadota bacterium]